MPLLRSLLSWRSSLYLDVDERLQLLRYLDRTGGKLAAARELLWPVKVSLWHLKETVLGRKSLFGSLAQRSGDAPPTTADIPVVRCVVAEPASEARQRHLFREADLQEAGELRLAGGARHRVGFTRTAPEQFVDFEDHNCYHRLYWTSRLAWAHRYGHPRAGALLRRQLEAWLDLDWSADRRVAFAYTTSERIIVLVETLQALREAPLPDAATLIQHIKQRIWLDARHLEQHVEHFLVAHNHIVTNARALAHAARQLPECADAPRWAAHAYELWDAMWPKLVLEDGSFKEGSSFYLLMNVRSVLDFLAFSAEDARPVSAELRRRLENAVRLAADLLRPDGSLPRFGNISPDHIVEDLQDVIAVARQRGVLTPDAPRAVADGRRPRVYADGGWGFLGDPASGLELVVHADPRPDPQTHSDAGKGSFELWCNGVTFFRDPGNSTYALTARRFFRSARAQNVTTIDGIGLGISEEFARMLPAEYVAFTAATLRAVDERLVLESDSWSRAWPGTSARRSWSMPRPAELLLEEELRGSAAGRRFASYLHLGDTPLEQPGANTFLLGTDAAKLRVVFSLPPGLSVSVEQTDFAPEYGVTKRGRVLIVHGVATFPLRWSLQAELLNG